MWDHVNSTWDLGFIHMFPPSDSGKASYKLIYKAPVYLSSKNTEHNLNTGLSFASNFPSTLMLIQPATRSP